MRVLNGFLALVLFGFAALQHNDPDARFWVAVYGGGAAWTLAATLVPDALGKTLLLWLLSLSLVTALLGVVYFWPDVPRWWRIEVWWQAETAREGMGIMIVAVALLVPMVTAMRARKSRRGAVAV